jgi:hypothetical protein
VVVVLLPVVVVLLERTKHLVLERMGNISSVLPRNNLKEVVGTTPRINLKRKVFVMDAANTVMRRDAVDGNITRISTNPTVRGQKLLSFGQLLRTFPVLSCIRIVE